MYRRLEAAGLARRGLRPAVDRPGLIEALDAGLSAPAIAARFGVSVSAICRALTREGLSTQSQTKRRQAAEHYATLVTLAEGSGAPMVQPSSGSASVFSPARAVSQRLIQDRPFTVSVGER